MQGLYSAFCAWMETPTESKEPARNEETTTEGFPKAAHPEVPEAKTSELNARSAGISPSMQDLYSRLSQRTDDSTKSRISVGRRRKRG